MTNGGSNIDYLSNAYVTFNNANNYLQMTNPNLGIDVIDYGYWHEHWYPSYPTYYPTYITYSNKFEQAFKIVSKLFEKKIIEKLTVKQFIELVNEIATNVVV